jgi:asparagine synthase (glutamine-hydrolysing)
MCGIVGALHRADAQPADMPAALRALAHRGPDGNGVWRGEGIELGHTRLAIIDLATGEQPMASQCGRYHIVFNGEIYNYRELRSELAREGQEFRTQSDTEVLLALFVKRGFAACLRALRGMFAFAVWDLSARKLYLARDRLGVKPLVYSARRDGFYFASEIGALRALLPGKQFTSDNVALHHYFTFQYIPSPMTGLVEVRKLPPAHAMIVGGDGIESLWRYWQIDASRRLSMSFGEATEAVRAKLLEATELRMIADVPLGAFLSGGIDSAITVANMCRSSETPVKTYCAGFSQQSFDERPAAAKAAAHLGTEHHEMLVTADAASALPMLIRRIGEPFGDDSLLPTYLVAHAARKHVTVALTGDGGDECFGGYRRHLQLARIARLEGRGLLPHWRRLRRWGSALEGRIRPDRRRPFPFSREDVALALRPVQRHLALSSLFDATERAHLYRHEFLESCGEASTWLAQRRALSEGGEEVNRILLTDAYGYLPEDVLYKVDIASMSASLECRSPLLDHELHELVAALPARYKLKGKVGKYLLRQAYASELPPGYTQLRKSGFSAPITRWLNEDLRELMCERLLAERRLAPWLREDAVATLVNAHLDGSKPNARRLWTLLVAAEWLSSLGSHA